MDMSLSKLQEWVMDREAWRAAVHVKSGTWLSDWTELNFLLSPIVSHFSKGALDSFDGEQYLENKIWIWGGITYHCKIIFESKLESSFRDEKYKN